MQKNLEWIQDKQNSADLFERAKLIAPGGVHSPVRAFQGVGGNPIFFSRADGPYLFSSDGDRYIDFCMSFGPLILGHRDPDISAIVHQMVDSVWTIGAPDPYSIELGEWIKNANPWLERLRFVNSGTEAVMSALRVARAATNRKRILKFSGCYHGHTDALLVKAGSGLAGISASSSAGVPEELVANTIILPLDSEVEVEKIFSTIGNEIACVVIEPLPANYGLLIQRNEFIQKVVSLARDSGTLVFFDEVISGFRVAKGGMAEKLGIIPDLVSYGKIIGGGFPVGCYGGKKELLDLVAPSGPVYQAGTLSANPIGMMAGLASLEKIFSNGNFQRLEARANSFFSELKNIVRKKDLPLQLIQMGSIFWFHWGHRNSIHSIDKISSEHQKWFKNFFHACLNEGVYLPPNAYEVGFISLAHEDSVLEQAIQSFTYAIEKASYA